MRNITILAVLLALLSGCVSVQKHNAISITPLEAIQLSNANAPKAITGDFIMTVKGIDKENQMHFLYSQSDHMDQRNLIVALRPNAVKELKKLHGQEPYKALIGKKIKIQGKAKRIKVWPQFDNRNLKNFYYQTQIFVKNANQIKVI